LQAYNAFLTAVPPLVFAVFEQDVDDATAAAEPQSYPRLSARVFTMRICVGPPRAVERPQRSPQ
jgi:hypothetical protein